MSSRVLAVFDFDHTITSWDTAARFFVWLIRRNILKLGIVLVVLPILGPLLAFPRARKLTIHFGVWIATFGVLHEQLPQLARAHMRDVTERGDIFVRRDALARLNDHLAQGHDVVVATGCLEVLAREILLENGLDPVIVVGSSIRRYFGGMVVDEHCFGANKIPMLAVRGFVEPWEFAYSDHHADLPLLLKGKQRFLVNPKPKCASKLTAALAETATIVSWN